jgi:hypothetical protein
VAEFVERCQNQHDLDFAEVELRGLEPLTPCLQSDVFVCCDRADLAGQLSVSSREIPLLTPVNGTLMARDLGASAPAPNVCMSSGG